MAVAVLLALTWAAPAGAASVGDAPRSSWSPWKACPNKPKDNCAMVRAIVRTSGGTVFLAGDFTQLRSPDGKSSIPMGNLAAMDDSGNPVRSFKPHTFNGTVFTLATDDTTVYAAGAFSKLDGTGALHLARFNAATGARIAIKTSINGTIYASVLAAGKFYIGGKFSTVQGAARSNLAALDPATGALDPTWAPAATLIPNDAFPNDPTHNDIPIRTLAAPGDASRIYVGGDMDLLNGQPQAAIGAVDPTTGATIGSFAPPVSSINKSYQGMAIVAVDASADTPTPGVILAAGGLGNRAWRLNLDGSVAWTINTTGDVQAAAVLGSTVYFGGHFDCTSTQSCFNAVTTDDTARMHIAAFDYNSTSNPPADPAWAPSLGPDWSPYYYGVWVIKAYGPSLYVGGVFKNVVTNGTTYNNAKYARFGPVVDPPPPPPPPPGSLFSDDFSSNTTAKWSAIGAGMTVSGGAATGVTPGKIAYLGASIGAARTSLDDAVKVKATALDPSNKVVLLRLTRSVAGGAPKGVLNVSVKPTGALNLRNEVGAVDRAVSATLSTGAQHLLDLRVTVSGTASTVRLSLDGTVVLNRTENLGSGGIDGIQIGDTGGSKSYTISWDDVVVTAGS